MIAAATHGVFSGPAYERLAYEESGIERIVVTDTMPLRPARRTTSPCSRRPRPWPTRSGGSSPTTPSARSSPARTSFSSANRPTARRGFDHVTVRALKRIGHKGADSIRPGNTLESFEAAVAAGVEMIELDVLRPRSEFPDGDWRQAEAGPAAAGAAPLLVAHDWGDAARRDPLTLDETLDAFTRAPLDQVEIDCDLKIAGREDDVVAALGQRGLTERASISTMEVSSLRVLRGLDAGLRLGWTVPRVTRDWNAVSWAKLLVIAGLVTLRRRLPTEVRRQAPELGVHSIWAYNHPSYSACSVPVCDSRRCCPARRCPDGFSSPVHPCSQSPYSRSMCCSIKSRLTPCSRSA